MPHVKLQDLPTKENVVTEPKQVIVKPIMAKPNAIAKLFGISYSSVNRILKEYDKDNKGVEDLYFSLSSTMTVISIDGFKEYLSKRHKGWLLIKGGIKVLRFINELIYMYHYCVLNMHSQLHYALAFSYFQAW